MTLTNLDFSNDFTGGDRNNDLHVSIYYLCSTMFYEYIYYEYIFDYVSFRSCNKPLRNIDQLTLDIPFSRTDVLKHYFLLHLVICGMNYLLVLGNLIPCQPFERN